MQVESIVVAGQILTVNSLIMTAQTSLNVTSDGGVGCTALMCVLQLWGYTITVRGPVSGGDIILNSNGSMVLSATISADAMGHGVEGGDGSGESINSWTTRQ